MGGYVRSVFQVCEEMYLLKWAGDIKCVTQHTYNDNEEEAAVLVHNIAIAQIITSVSYHL